MSKTGLQSRKLLAIVAAAVLAISVFALAGCGSSSSGSSASASGSGSASSAASSEASSSAAAEPIKVTVAATPVPHAEILNEVVKPLLAEQGYDLEVREFTDYVLPNTATEEGEVDANYFQHIPYLDSFNEEQGTHLVNVAGVHIEPMRIYAGKTASLEELADGAQVAVPNDTTNEARALLLLQSAGLITLSDPENITATVNDIADNPKNLQFVEVEAANVPNARADVDIAVINTNYALEAQIPESDILYTEAGDSPYVNVLVVREGNENNPEIQALVAAITSDEVKQYINEKYNGEVIAV